MLSRLFKLGRREGVEMRPRTHRTSAASNDPLVLDQQRATTDSVAELASVGDYGQALALIDGSLARVPDDPNWVLARGDTLFEWGRFREARSWLLKAAALGVEHPSLLLRTGWSCMWTADAQSAEPWMRKLGERAPHNWLGHFGLGSSLRAQGRIDEAVTCFERALERSPGNAECLVHLFECRYAQGRLEEAEAFARSALEAEPANPRHWTTLGIALIAQDRFREATDAFQRGEVMAKGADADPHLNLAICLRDTGRVTEALALYEQELPRRPSIGTQAHYGHALLTAGRFAEGWLHYEFRWMQEPLLSLRPSFRKPLWSGQNLSGKTILLRCEQGIGDVIQFIRYAPHVKALGATVLLQLRKNISELARSFPGVDQIIEPGEGLPEFDFYLHLMSLPRLFGTVDVDSIASEVPYLSAEPSRVDSWVPRLVRDGAFKVGVVWAGDANHLRDRYRSIPFEKLAPLLRVDGARFFSLQKGAQAAQIDALSDDVSLEDLGSHLRDFADTAAVLTLLDLVICVDTSVAHLAGALGVRVWTLVATPADWRWLEACEDSPWYPTMRLFRQGRPGDWDDVIVRVAKELAVAVARPALSSLNQAANRSAMRRASLEPPSDEPSCALKPDLTSVAETRFGIVQYWPCQEPIGRSIERYGEYLQVQLDVVAPWITTGATIVEAGADIGLHALCLASMLGPTGHLLLYEDDPLRRQVLRQNLDANRAGNVTVMKRCLRTDRGNRSSEAPLASPHKVVEDSIDDLRLEALHWIKVNDPAITMSVLDGAVETVWRLRPRLWLSTSDAEASRVLAAKVRDFGYRCFAMETPLFNPRNFNRRPVDVFNGRVACALLAVPEEATNGIAFDDCNEV